MAKAKLDWINPTTRTDGSSLSPADIASIDIWDGSAVIGNVNATTFTTGDLSIGDHSFTVVVNDTLGHKADASNVASLNVPEPVVANPSPATNLTAALV